MKIKTNELTGAALDWAVAKAHKGREEIRIVSKTYIFWRELSPVGFFAPSTDWAQGGPIIEREKLGVTFEAGWEVPRWSAWGAGVDEPRTETYAGDTPLEAAMRCFVASKLGDEVEVPEELV